MDDLLPLPTVTTPRSETRSISPASRVALLATITAIAAVALAAPREARAQSRSDDTVYDHDDEARGGPEVLPVRARFARPLDARCALRATLTGELRAAPERARYAPALRVETAVECEGRTTARVVRTLRSAAPLTPEELSLALDARARLHARGASAPCEYRPAFEFDGARFTRMTVAQSCALEIRRGRR